MNDTREGFAVLEGVTYGLALATGLVLLTLVMVVAANPYVEQPDGPVLLITWFISLPVQLIGAAWYGYILSSARRHTASRARFIRCLLIVVLCLFLTWLIFHLFLIDQ